jgi:hypothetical protein
MQGNSFSNQLAIARCISATKQAHAVGRGRVATLTI